ncbi:NAD(P)H-quinone oxidoreductase [uncultured Devosia sp.]|uniref:NAD(P)H-quinone oxidoreductase n=1 Tax=uncultured Devosia sp. TaxID=211434 RepID=UPI0035CBA780
MPLPQTMTQIEITRFGAPDVLDAREAPVPLPRAGEVLIKVAAAGVNRPDILQRQGHYSLPPDASPIPGLEVAGEIVALGDGVTGFAMGDKVCALTNGGGYAQYCNVPAGQVLPIPSGVDMIKAAAIPETCFTVWANLFALGGAKAGMTALVHGGTSGIGTTALMMCREFGIRAFATAGSDEKCAAVTALGGIAINYRDAVFDAVVLEHTKGRGVDIVLDLVGARYFEQNLRVLAQDGTIVLVGMMGGSVVEKFNLSAIMAKRARITGSTMRPRSAAEKAAIAAGLQAQVWPAVAAGRCLPIVHQVFPLAEAAQAHRMMEAGDHIGKIVLEVNPAP